jgi:hypothetical protein
MRPVSRFTTGPFRLAVSDLMQQPRLSSIFIMYGTRSCYLIPLSLFAVAMPKTDSHDSQSTSPRIWSRRRIVAVPIYSVTPRLAELKKKKNMITDACLLKKSHLILWRQGNHFSSPPTPDQNRQKRKYYQPTPFDAM